MKTLVKKDLTEAVESLGWSDSLAHLADMARSEGHTGLSGTLKLLADVWDGAEGDMPVPGLANDPLGLMPDGYDDPAWATRW